MPHSDRAERPVVNVAELPDDDPNLVRRAQQRDEQAFAVLYRRHGPRVYALCLRMCANDVRATELTQTVFVNLWPKLSLFRGESTFATWLHRFAVNIVLIDFRTTRRREGRVIATDQPETFAQPTSTPTAGLRLDLEQAIAALPDQARAVFVLHDVEGYTHDEIARLMNLAPGTTKAHLHRARKQLQEALQ